MEVDGSHCVPDGPAPAVTHRGTQSDHGQMHRLLLEELGPPSLLVDEQYQVLHLSESVGRFLHVPGGTLTSDVRRLVPSELQPGLQWALAAAFADGHTVYTEPVPVQFDDMLQLVTLAVQPTRQGQHALILFFAGEATTLPTLPSPTVIDQAAPTDGEMLYALALRRLRQRLFALDLGDTTTVVELRDSNAELLSTNEEYRLLLNDGEVHKEELSSANEELRAVNEELTVKAQQSSETYTDLQNFLAATEIDALYLDRELRVVRYTAHAAALFNLIPSDRGRPIDQLQSNLRYDTLVRDARQVLRDLTPIAHDIECADGCWYLVILRPYRTLQEQVQGVVITLVDITANKQTELALAEAKAYAESIVQTIPDALLVLGPDLRVQSANSTFYTIFHANAAETEGRLIYELGHGEWEIPELHTLLEEILPHNQSFIGYEVTGEFATIGRRTMLLNGRRLGHDQLILLAITDITARKAAEDIGAAKSAIARSSAPSIRPLRSVKLCWTRRGAHGLSYAGGQLGL
ncbi:MAG: PAS domain-containing protein [Caldilineaceae bacterium]